MKLNSFFRFGVVGAFGFCVDVSALYILMFFGLDYFSGRVISFLLAVTFTWQLNRRFTFLIQNKFTLRQEAWRYFLASSFGGAINISIYSFVVLISNPLPFVPLIGVALGSIAGMCTNYFAAKNLVFQSK